MRTLKGEKLEQELLRLEAMKEYEKNTGQEPLSAASTRQAEALWPVRW